MRVAVPTQDQAGERRVALVPKSVEQLKALGCEVVVQKGAGVRAGYSDEAYREAGAEISGSAGELLAKADVTVVIRRPEISMINLIPKNSTLIGLLDPLGNPAILSPLTLRQITAFRLEAMPRISRAQDMDVLSSAANLAGYYAVVLAASKLPRIFPLMITAAGTITPAKVLVIGAGVAGLQAIATAKRLGAVIEAFDVRPAVKEQVESLGGKFIDAGLEAHDTETAGGYAKELAEDQAAKEREVLAQHGKDADVIITTAFIPNQKAPLLVTKETVNAMRQGSVIVDMAASSGGNCELSKADQEITTPNGVLILGPTNLPAALAPQSSQVYSHNVTRFLSLMIKEAQLKPDFEDEVVAKTCMTRDGKVLDESLAAAAGKR